MSFLHLIKTNSLFNVVFEFEFVHLMHQNFRVSIILSQFTHKSKYSVIILPRESKKIVQELQMSLTLIKSLNHRFVVVLMKKT